jgi:lysophosphatidylcholine acyltransferase/lyso-PAF acetyltransferase
MRILLLVMGFVYVPTRGRPAGTAEAPVIVSNHVCFLEPIYLLSVFGAMPVGEQSNLKAPVIGPIIRALQLIGVDRKDPNSRHAVAEAIKQRAASHAWQQILLFPEGTCTVGNALIQFKPGAFNPGAPVQPCLVRYHNARSNPAWVCGGPKVAVLLVRMLCEPINFLSCEYLPTYVPSTAEKADAILFARNVRAAMAARLGVCWGLLLGKYRVLLPSQRPLTPCACLLAMTRCR